jgi:hypothetical protein
VQKQVKPKAKVIAATLLFLCCAAGPDVAAQGPVLGLPVACTIGEDCWVVNYVDTDPAPGRAADFRCGPLTYDAHKGTDIAIRDWAAMQRGVDVVAAADGTVLRARDGMPDRVLSREERQELLQRDRACGNGVFLDHGAGWRTIYCHMKNGSIAVAAGETVQAGRKLGEVGHSGAVEFPHLHLGVFHGEAVIDPFTGLDHRDGCGAVRQSLWREGEDPGYQPVSIFAAGFDPGEPDFEAIGRDAASPDSLPAEVKALTFWAAFYGARRDDRIRLEIRDPAGRVFAQRDIVQPRDRIRQFYFVGRRAPARGLARGTWIGTLELVRDSADGAPVRRGVSRTLVIE